MQGSSATRPRLNAVTSLRFFAAFYVVLFHLHSTGLIPWASSWVKSLAGLGYLGVNFFFVLSGFVLVYTYSDREFSAREFWVARFARVYPAYAISLIVSLPMFSWMLIHLNFPFLAWIKEHLSLACLMVATLTQSWIPQIASAWNPVAWSLAVEAFFYLCFPWLCPLMAKSRRTGLVVWLIAAWAVTLLISGTYVLSAPDGVTHTTSAYENLFWLNVVRFDPLACLPEFIVGMATGFIFLRAKISTSAGTWMALAGVFSFLLAVALNQQLPYPMLHSGLLSPAFGAIIFSVALRPRWSELLEVRWLVLLGEASYSLYLLHFTFIWSALVMWGRTAANPLANLGLVTAAIIASLLSYKFIEQPARRRLRTLHLRQLSAAA